MERKEEKEENRASTVADHATVSLLVILLHSLETPDCSPHSPELDPLPINFIVVKRP